MMIFYKNKTICNLCYSLTVLFFFSCTPVKNGTRDEKLYPKEIEINPEMGKKLENYDPDFFCYMDTEEMKLYSLGDYLIFQSVLTGPTGRGSNYYYQLLVNKDFSKDMFFMSLSGEIRNVWLSKDTLFINLLDFDDEAYYNGEYFLYDSCDFVLTRTKKSTSSFSLDTIDTKKIRIMWKDAVTYTIPDATRCSGCSGCIGLTK